MSAFIKGALRVASKSALISFYVNGMSPDANADRLVLLQPVKHLAPAGKEDPKPQRYIYHKVPQAVQQTG